CAFPSASSRAARCTSRRGAWRRCETRGLVMERRKRSTRDPDATSLFEGRVPPPLAARMRPRTLDEVVGQQQLLAPGKPLREAIERGNVGSMIFWGPPGSGKTTIARAIA